MLSEAQGEAVITALAQHALADAESRRSLAGPRGEEAIAAARLSHAAEAAAWRDVLRRNDLAVVSPMVAETALADLVRSEAVRLQPHASVRSTVQSVPNVAQLDPSSASRAISRPSAVVTKMRLAHAPPAGADLGVTDRAAGHAEDRLHHVGRVSGS